jgi:hypothetical protein
VSSFTARLTLVVAPAEVVQSAARQIGALFSS